MVKLQTARTETSPAAAIAGIAGKHAGPIATPSPGEPCRSDRAPITKIAAPAVTVLMSVREVPLAMLREAVESILAQTMPDFEFRIYGDGANEAALVAALESYAARDPRVIVRHGPPRGLTKTLNLGLGEARARFIARQDADDWSEPERLARQLEFLERHPDVAVCGSNAWMRQENGALLWTTRLPGDVPAIERALWGTNPFVHGATMFRAAAARAAGGYCEAFACSQDYDFFWRLCDHGGGANLAAPLYHYRFRRGAVSAERAGEQARVHKATQALAWARHMGAEADVHGALAEAGRQGKAPRERLAARLKQADHRMLAGDYVGAARSYAALAFAHPASAVAWGKLARWCVFVAAPPLRRWCFRSCFFRAANVP